MKNKLWILFFLALQFSLFSQGIGKNKNGFFYGSLELSSFLRIKVPDIGYIDDDQEYYFQRSTFNFRSPALEVGYLYRGKFLFLKAGASYWMGRKQMAFRNDYRTIDISQRYQNNGYNLQPGDIFYVVNESFNGKLDLHNVDVSLVASGRALWNTLTLFGGFRKSMIVYHTIYGEYREVIYKGRYEGLTTPTLLETSEVTYMNNQAKNKTGQKLMGFLYVTVGLNASFLLAERNCFVQFDYNYALNSETVQNSHNASFNLKFGLSFLNYRPNTVEKP